jgi:hypothetical protein
MPRSPARSPLIALTLALALLSSGCFRGGGRLFGAMAWTAIVTSAIVSSHPPPREVLVTAPPPAPRPGHSWQPGYWAPYQGHWVWVPGRSIRNHPGYTWNPAHWVEDPGGRWRLVPGEWLPAAPFSPPAPGAPLVQPAPGAPANGPEELDEEDDEAPPPPPGG